MNCEQCDQRAISTKPSLCKDHFDSFILKTAQETIDQFGLFTKNDRICVAVSGGKDSLALLDVLTRLGYAVEGLFINEGITNYREFSLKDLDDFIKRSGIKVRTVSFEQEAGFGLDTVMKTKQFHACTVCGTLRRYLLNKYAQDYDVIATGHNMDDEAQTVLMNLARGNSSLFLRTGPKTTENEASIKRRFVPRVKPFYFVSEKHLLTYTVIHRIKTDFGECPYAPDSYRMHLTEILNRYEEEHPGTKKHILETYLALREPQQHVISIEKEEFDHLSAGDVEIPSGKAEELIEEIASVLKNQ
ncbi:MAG: tRNA 2-thiocytidine biosynthesis protein TtcA [Nanoarchaeota archaeon]|nr:tRNA 2-thiocytidine biosynthesis protein TtcA [Nanoarchaeota archaeon]